MELSLNDLKIMLAYKVSESNLSKADKQNMINFIKEANEHQIKHMFLTGRMARTISSTAIRENNRLFESREVQHALSEGLLKTIFGMFLLNPAGWAMYRLIRATFSKNSRKCGAFSIGKQRDLCLIRAKITKFEKLINLVKSQMVNCKESKNPEKCKAAGMRKIENWKSDIRELQARLQDIKGEPKQPKQGPSVNINVRKQEG